MAHEGYHASSLGLRGIPGAAEALGVERGVLLSELTGSALHVAHMSARASIRAVRKGKELEDMGARYVGFECPDEFVVGYGLDYNGRYRNLPFIGVLRPEVYR